jgi:hypothetical protein
MFDTGMTLDRALLALQWIIAQINRGISVNLGLNNTSICCLNRGGKGLWLILRAVSLILSVTLKIQQSILTLGFSFRLGTHHTIRQYMSLQNSTQDTSVVFNSRGSRTSSSS